MEFTKTYKKPHKSLPTPQKVISFKAFEVKEKSKIQSAYPFLSPKQIKGKIKDRWNKLTDEEKQSYTVYKLEPTHKLENEKKDAKGTKRKFRSFPDFFSPKPKTAKFDLEECNTPESINTQKLTDFRRTHQEIYKNDFSVDSDIVNDSPESSLFPSDHINTYKPSGNIGTKRKPLVCKKAENQGILKNSDSAKKGRSKATVSFDSQSEVNTYNTDTDGDLRDRTDDLDDYHSIDDSDDEESFLIHREDTELGTQSEYITDDCSQSDHKGYDKEFKINEGDADKGRVTDRNTINDKNIEASSGLDPSRDKLESIRSKAALNSTWSGKLRKRKLEIATSNTTELFKSPLPSKVKKLKGSSKKKTEAITVIRNQTPDMGKIKHQSSSQVTPVMSNMSENPDDYITPQMDESLQQLTTDQVVKAPQKSRQARKSIDARERVQAQLVTKQVNRFLLVDSQTEVRKGKGAKLSANNEGKENDLKTSKIANEELNKQLKSNESDSSWSKTEVLASVRRSRRSTRLSYQSVSSKTNSNRNTHSDDINENLTSGRHEIKDQNNNDVNDNDYNVVNMNPSGDAGKGLGEKAIFNADDNDVQNDSKGDDQHDTCCPVKHRRSLRRRRQSNSIETRSLTSTSTSSSSQDSKLSSSDNSPKFNDEEMELSIKKKVERSNNPVLEKALKLLQLTTGSSSLNNSPVTYSLDSMEAMDTFSPSLLSPALSGISELSSASSSLTNSQESSLPMKASQSTKEEGLTQLFTDLTPPEQKTQGLYKTKRALMSDDKSMVTMSMKEYFSGEADIF